MPGVAARRSRDAEIMQYVPLVYKVVRNITNRMPSFMDREALIGAGMVGLMSAVQKYDVSKGVAFEAYARIRIRGAVQDELRTMDHLTRGQRKSTRSIHEAREDLQKKTGAPVDDHALASDAKLSVEEIQQGALLRAPPQAVDPADLDQQHLNNPWQDIESTEERVARREQLALVRAALSKLPERDQTIMGLYYEEELTLEEIGTIINVSQSRVSQLIGKVKRKLRAELAEAA